MRVFSAGGGFSPQAREKRDYGDAQVATDEQKQVAQEVTVLPEDSGEEREEDLV